MAIDRDSFKLSALILPGDPMELLFPLLLVVGAVMAFRPRFRLDPPLRRTTVIRSEDATLEKGLVARQTASKRGSAEVLVVEVLELCGRAWVIDGDTIDIGGTRIRLSGIDAPEMDHPYGKSAKWALIKLCKGQEVRAVFDGDLSHDRTVATCYLSDGRDLSAEMVKAGLAIDWPKFSRGKYSGLELPGIRKKLWRCDARQKGLMPPGLPDQASPASIRSSNARAAVCSASRFGRAVASAVAPFSSVTRMVKTSA